MTMIEGIVPERANEWFFFHDLSGRWCWEYRGDGSGARMESTQSYDTREECVADATLHGYKAPKAIEPRPRATKDCVEPGGSPCAP